MNLTKLNAGYFSRELLIKARPAAVFVNIARGELAPASVLLGLLNEGPLGGVGSTCMRTRAGLQPPCERAQMTRPLWMQDILALMGHENAILTPHNAFTTQESVQRKASQSIDQAEHFLRHGEFIWQVSYNPL
jgi:D-lactate dehydrogenase